MYPKIKHNYIFPAPIELGKVLICAIFLHFIITQDVKSDENIFGRVTKYLQWYSDIDIESIVFVEGNIENDIEEIRHWYDQVTFISQEQMSDILPFVYTRNALKDSAKTLTNVLLRNQKASLVVADIWQISNYSSNPLNYLSEELLRSHVWLFLYPYKNITENNLRSLTIFRQLENNENLKFDSQASTLSYYFFDMVYVFICYYISKS